MIGVANIALLSSFLSTKQDLFFLMFLALLVDGAVISVWYLLGVLIGSSRFKESARGEFVQLIGTGVMAFAAIFALATAAGVLNTFYGATALMNPTAMSTMCTNIEGTTSNPSPLSILGPTDSLLSGNPKAPNTFPGLCSYLSPSTTDVGTEIDYPIAASGVVLANLTNQSATNLNSLYWLESFVFWEQSLTVRSDVCTGDCNPDLNPAFTLIMLEYRPYSGFKLLKDFGNIVGNLQGLEVESFTAQLIFVVIVLSIWPWLFFIGLILRATFFTRKLGGMMMAIALGAILFTPILISSEYLTLSSPTGQAALYTTNGIYGFNAVTNLPASSCYNNEYASASSVFKLVNWAFPSLPGDVPLGQSYPCTKPVAGGSGATTFNAYNLNFYIQPNFEAIAQVDNCWGGNGKYYWANLAINAAVLAIPGPGLLTGITALLSQVLPSSINIFQSAASVIPVQCAQPAALKTFFDLTEATAIGGIAGYFLPILNILIVFAGIRGLSGVFGGDTNFAGLSKLL